MVALHGSPGDPAPNLPRTPCLWQWGSSCRGFNVWLQPHNLLQLCWRVYDIIILQVRYKEKRLSMKKVLRQIYARIWLLLRLFRLQFIRVPEGGKSQEQLLAEILERSRQSEKEK